LTTAQRPGEECARHLFAAWPQVSRRLRRAERWLLLLDFDGTLAPFTSDPQAARLESDVRPVLSRLARNPRARLYIVSGRPLAYLRRWASVPGVRLLGLHGWERPGMARPVRERRRVLEVKRWLGKRLAGARGIKIEDKGIVLAVHYRAATPEEVKLAQEATLQVLWSSQRALRLIEGKMIWELAPSFIEGKGAAAARLLAKLSPGWLPIYAGDDESDECAFAILRRGVTIQVGGRPDTKARFWLRDPSEVREFLERLEALMPPGRS